MKISVTREEFAKLCGWCFAIKETLIEPSAHCEQCALWHICDGQGIEMFIEEIVMPNGR